MSTTLNTVSDFAIILYAWNNPVLPLGKFDSDPGKSGRLIKTGIHFLSFQRTKNIGGTATLDIFGNSVEAELGDWLVIKTSSSTAITEDNYAEAGIVRFIGQISSISSRHFADSEGNLRVTSQIVVREWSHALNMPVKYDQLTAIINSKEFTQTQSLAAKSSSSAEELTRKVNDYLEGRYNAFQAAEIILDIAGAISRSVAPDNTVQRFEVSHRLPSFPKNLLEDNLVAFQPSSKTSEASWVSPWDTGVVATAIGVQASESVRDVSSFSSIKDYIDFLKLEKLSRPGKAFDRASLNSGYTVVNAVSKSTGENPLYEIYTDLIFTKDQESNIWKATPALVIRDKPISFKKLWSSPNADKSGDEFKWTYIDFIPRTVIDAASVISIGLNQDFSSVYNFLRFDFAPKVYKSATANVEALLNGVKLDIASQYRFGTQEFGHVVEDYIGVEDLSKSTENFAQNWFRAQVLRALNFFSYTILFPSANIHIKDIDYPISVGNCISIKLPTGVTVVGEVEKINCQYKVEGDGKKVNNTYLEVSKLSMVDPADNLLMPIPRRVLKDIVKIAPENEDLAEVKRQWSYKE